MSAGRPRAREGDQGFVLVEMLAALSVLAVMAVLMTGFMNNLRSVSRLEGEIARGADLSATTSFLRRTLAGVKAAPLPDNQPTTNFLFDGSADGMRFAAVTRRGFHSLALRDIRIFTRRVGARTELVQSLAARRGTGVAPPTPFAEIVVDDDISSVLFEYANETGGFSSNWHLDSILPSAVRMTVTRVTGKRQISATAIARIR